MLIRVDISLFASPTDAFGVVTGEMEVQQPPKAGESFPWPVEWLAARPKCFAAEQSLVSSVEEREGALCVMLCGIVCESVVDARECGAFLSQRGGLEFWEFTHDGRGV